jgi:hypothetical protein
MSSMSVPSSSAPPEPVRRTKVLGPVRLSTFLLLMVVVALLIALYAQRVHEAQLRDALSTYRNYRQEGMYDALDQPVALTYPDGASLDVVLKAVRMRTSKNPKMPKIPVGIPIYVDPIGLQEAEVSLNSPVKRPPSADTMAFGEHLRRVLESVGLGYIVKDGYIMITSGDSIDVPVGEDADLYLQYRDVLR